MIRLYTARQACKTLHLSRSIQGLTVQSIVDYAAYSPQTILRLEKDGTPNLHTFLAWAHALGHEIYLDESSIHHART